MARRFVSMYYGSIGKKRALQALVDWVGSAWRAPGARRDALRQAVRDHVGEAEVFAFGSGRSSLAACLQAAGIGAGDEVILSSYTCLAVPTAVIAAGATPVYVDINPETLNVETETVLSAIGPRVRAIVVQHTLGKTAPIRAIIEGAKRHGVLVIEDCALAVGSRTDGCYLGSLADAGFMSMELSKTLSCGWGGLLIVNHSTLAAATRDFYATLPEPGVWAATRDIWQTAISAWCNQPELLMRVGRYVLHLGFLTRFFRRSTPPGEFEGDIGHGFMAKMPGAHAALATRQWRDFDAIIAACDKNACALREVLQELDIHMPAAPQDGEVAIAPRVPFLATDRQEAVQYFDERGIELGQWFDGPLSPEPTAPVFNYRREDYPNAMYVARHMANLPCHSRMNARDVEHVANTLRAYVGEQPGRVLQNVH